MKLHSFGKLFSLVIVLVLMISIICAFSITANAESAEPEIELNVVLGYRNNCELIKIEWTAVDGATEYDVFHNGMQIALLSTDFEGNPFYVVKDVDVGAEHTFEVVAINDTYEVLGHGIIVVDTEHTRADAVEENRVEPTCTVDGSYDSVVYCSVCNEELSRETVSISTVNAHNIVHVDAVEPDCHYLGNIEYWYCSLCGATWEDEALTMVSNRLNVIRADSEKGEVVHVDAVEPGCHYLGNIEYWYCKECEQVWQNESLTQLTNMKNVILPATGNPAAIHIEAVAPGCHDNGNIEYWICYDCEQVWQDEALTQLTNIKNVILPATGDTAATHVEAVAPGCHYIGNIEYWYCEKCEKVWQDEALTQLTNLKNILLPATGDPAAIHVEAVAPGCHYDGNIEYWICYDCEQVWQDEALTQLTNIKNVVLPATKEGNVVHMEAVAPGCHYDGNIEYWICYDCEKVWQDEALTQLTNIKNVVLPATKEGNVVHMEAVAPDCHYIGNIEYWICYDCEKVWQDEALTQLTNIKNVVLPATGDTAAIHVEAVANSCTENGNIEYWYCEKCEQVWQDEALTQLTNRLNVVLPAFGHTEAEAVKENNVEPSCTVNGSYDSVVYCSVCGEELSRETVIRLAPGHTEAEAVEENRVEPTCTVDGSYDSVVYCSVCGEELSRVTLPITAPGHTEAEAVEENRVEPTCTVDGSYDSVVYCSVCGEELSRVTLPITAPGHTEVVDEAQDPTCTETGLTAGKHCSVCDEVLVAQNKVDALGHTEVVDKAIDPTCTKPGLTAGKHCSVCDAVLAAQTTVNALGHTWTDATCTDAKTCSTCKAKDGKPLGHIWTDATCDTPSTCSVCEATTGNALGHTWSEATCEENSACVVCQIEGEEKALGHNYSPDTNPDVYIVYNYCETCKEKGDIETVQIAEKDKDTITTVAVVAACALVIILCIRALTRPATTTPWYRRGRYR